jgi:hypothetical protein
MILYILLSQMWGTGADCGGGTSNRLITGGEVNASRPAELIRHMIPILVAYRV